MAKCTSVSGKLCCFYEEEEPKTNADHIRSMSDEELAEVLCQAMFCRTCLARHECIKTSEDNCRADHIKWLKQPHKENTNE